MKRGQKTYSMGWKNGAKYVPTIRWCLVFQRPFSSIALREDTPVTLEGMIGWQNLSQMTKPGPNVVDFHEIVIDAKDRSLLEEGILCTLGELASGGVRARFSLEFLAEDEKSARSKELHWQGIGSKRFLSALKEYQRKVSTQKVGEETRIPLDRFIRPSDSLEEKRIKYRAALAVARGVSITEIPLDHVSRHISRDLNDRSDLVIVGSRAKAALYNSKDEVVSSLTFPFIPETVHRRR